MVNGSLAKECGRRLRRVRMARNMSQQELADMLYTTAQNISKYEKDGIGNIDTISKINETLECNLLKDEIDVEGTIGEIGKQILIVLIEHNGFVEVNYLIDKYMFGLNSNQITKEIIKLENIGLCVREQYVGLKNDKHDGLFITAKGIISLKNNNPSLMPVSVIRDKISLDEISETNLGEFLHERNIVRPLELQTYEQVVSSQGYETYQEYIDSHELERLVFSLPKDVAYRANEIWFLKRNYLEDVEWFGEKVIDSQIDIMMNHEYGVFLSTEEIYIDILHRMVLGLNHELLSRIFESYRSFDKDFFDVTDGIKDNLILLYAPEYEQYRDFDADKWRALTHFRGLSEWYDNYCQENGINKIDYSKLTDEKLMSLDKTSFSAEHLKWVELYEEYNARLDEEFSVTDVLFEQHLTDMAKEKKSVLVTEWFSKEEIEACINEMFLSDETDEVDRIDTILSEIYSKYPEVYKAYFSFPSEWEDNGLADLIREKIKIQK